MIKWKEITGAIVGVGSVRRLSAERWVTPRRIVCAWVLTIPPSAFIAVVCYRMLALLAQVDAWRPVKGRPTSGGLDGPPPPHMG